ncbi:MAG: helicase-associated domain-containing protein, partial [FCB group bacterium]|nr:helicase-associated domain-containing protein [FCB group bacterium]
MNAQTYTIKECLHGYTNEALGTMCGHWKLASGNKPGRIRALERVLMDPLHLTMAIALMDEAALRLAHLIAGRGLVDTADLLSVPGLYCRQKPELPLQKLAQTGLVLSCPQERAGAFSFSHLVRKYQPGETGPMLFIPDAVRRLLPAAPAVNIPVPVAPAPANAAEPGPERATGIFLETLRIVEAVSPRVTSTGELHKSDEVRGQELCRDADISADALSLALMIARQMGCVEEKEGRLRTTPKAEQWAEESPANRMREMFRAYLDADDLPDLRIFFPEIAPAMEKRMPSRSLRRGYHRKLIAQILSEQPEGEWHSFDSLIETARVLDRNVLFLEERWRAIESNAREFSAAWQERAWAAHEKRFFTWMVGTLFAELGIVQASEDAGVFRVTPSGRYALGVGPAPEAPANQGQDALLVQADFEVIAFLDRCPAGLRRKLDTFCDRKRGGPVSTYVLTQDSMYRGVRTGVSAAEFMRLIERCASKGIPSNVRQQFLTWERKLETVTILSSCNLIECRNAEDAAALAADTPKARVIGERYVLVNGTVPEVPVRIEYNGARKPCLEQAAGLKLRVPWAKCDLFAPRLIEGLGEISTEDGDLVLTLSRGKSKRTDWDPVLEKLESYTGTPLAARYRATLHAWNGEVEPAVSRAATLVRFGDPESCQAALEIPELAQHLEGALGRFVVVVKQGELTTFKKKLKEYGISMAAGDVIVDGPEDNSPAPTSEPVVEAPKEARKEEAHAEKAAPSNGHGDRKST